MFFLTRWHIKIAIFKGPILIAFYKCKWNFHWAYHCSEIGRCFLLVGMYLRRDRSNPWHWLVIPYPIRNAFQAIHGIWFLICIPETTAEYEANKCVKFSLWLWFEREWSISKHIDIKSYWTKRKYRTKLSIQVSYSKLYLWQLRHDLQLQWKCGFYNVTYERSANHWLISANALIWIHISWENRLISSIICIAFIFLIDAHFCTMHWHFQCEEEKKKRWQLLC